MMMMNWRGIVEMSDEIASFRWLHLSDSNLLF